MLLEIVIAGLTRNPGPAWHWIPDQVRDDNFFLSLRAATRNPCCAWHSQKAWTPDRLRDDNCGVPGDSQGRDDKVGSIRLRHLPVNVVPAVVFAHKAADLVHTLRAAILAAARDKLHHASVS